MKTFLTILISFLVGVALTFGAVKFGYVKIVDDNTCCVKSDCKKECCVKSDSTCVKSDSTSVKVDSTK